MTSETTIRLDKWLWAARIYKTRAMASQAISGGKVHYNAQRTKPSQRVDIDAQVTIKQGIYEKIVLVRGLASVRRGAKEALLLYAETAASIQIRMALAEQGRLIKTSFAAPAHRPNKKQRRQIIQFKQKI